MIGEIDFMDLGAEFASKLDNPNTSQELSNQLNSTRRSFVQTLLTLPGSALQSRGIDVDFIPTRLNKTPNQLLSGDTTITEVDMFQASMGRLQPNEGFFTRGLTICVGLAMKLSDRYGEEQVLLAHLPTHADKSFTRLLMMVEGEGFYVKGVAVAAYEYVMPNIKETIEYEKIRGLFGLKTEYYPRPHPSTAAMIATNSGGVVFQKIPDFEADTIKYAPLRTWNW